MSVTPLKIAVYNIAYSKVNAKFSLDFRLFITYNTSIGHDGNKYPSRACLKRAFGWWKKAAAVWTNTSPSPNVKFCSSVSTVRRLQRSF